MTYANYETVLVRKTISIMEAVKLMNRIAMQVLLVTDDERNLLGVITDGDIRRAILANLDFSESIASIMTCNPVTMTHPPNKEKAIRLMKKNDIRHIPLVNEMGKISGLLRWKDFFENGDVAVSKKPNSVVIMAGGKGTRLDLFTKILPKPLIPIGEKPIIEHIMDNFHKYGFERFILSLNYKADMIKAYFSDANYRKYLINYTLEKKFMGTAGSLSLLRQRLDDTFIVSNCDVMIDANLEHLFSYHKKNGNHATILGIVRNVEIPYGVLKTHQGDLEDIIEKPEYHFVINSGIYVLEPEVIGLIKDGQQIDMPDFLMAAKKKGYKVQTYPITCSWFDVGQWGEYKRAIQHITSLGLES
jgi:dTDP-glucose pyrophosphorylase